MNGEYVVTANIEFRMPYLQRYLVNLISDGVRTLRHQIFFGAELSHGHFGLVPNCLGTEVS